MLSKQLMLVIVAVTVIVSWPMSLFGNNQSWYVVGFDN